MSDEEDSNKAENFEEYRETARRARWSAFAINGEPTIWGGPSSRGSTGRTCTSLRISTQQLFHMSNDDRQIEMIVS